MDFAKSKKINQSLNLGGHIAKMFYI